MGRLGLRYKLLFLFAVCLRSVGGSRRDRLRPLSSPEPPPAGGGALRPTCNAGVASRRLVLQGSDGSAVGGGADDHDKADELIIPDGVYAQVGGFEVASPSRCRQAGG